ncbi:MAG: hypothetical protein JO126_05360 [Alphaproteobacteria bacterium]|nr:hypothetical protein [Alphaproteobacteria bacterium]
MTATTKFLLLAFALSLGLMVTGPVDAQSGETGPPPPNAAMPDNNGQPDEDWRERRDFREERERLREEHEQLQNEREQVRARCGDAGGNADCETRLKDIHDRREALHERMKNLRTRMESEHAEAVWQAQKREHPQMGMLKPPQDGPGRQAPPNSTQLDRPAGLQRN